MIRLFPLLILLLGIALSCAPPHTNPLDPDSDHYVPPPVTPAPDFLQARLRSVHTARTPFAEDHAVYVDAWSSGPRALDSVAVSFAGGAAFRLDSVVGARGMWFTSLDGSVLGDADLGSVVGQPFTLLFHLGDSTYVRRPYYVFRVIDATPRVLEPDSMDQTGAHPLLVWDRFTAGFPFTYRVTVLQRIPFVGEVVIWDSSRVAASARQLMVTEALADGNYHWSVAVVDTFENLSESIEGSFVVVAGEEG